MCVTPVILPNGTEVACRKCWQCKENYISDWVGRCIAESEVSHATTSVTLTYGKGAGWRDAILTYSDFQNYIRALRQRHGYPVRFIVAGEYGSLRGRAHWHAILFWQERVPPHQEATRFREEHWPHGWSFWERPTVGALKYVCKYIQKDARDDARQGHFAMSKKPPLGFKFFVQRASDLVDAGLAPQDGFYSFRDVRDKSGEPVRFCLRRNSLDLFLKIYLDLWAMRRGGHPPVSELLENWCDENSHYVLSRMPFLSCGA